MTGTLPVAIVSTQTIGVTATGAATNRSMTTTPGAAQVAPTLASLAQTAAQTNWFRRFVSPPIAAQTIAAQTWNSSIALITSNATNSPWAVVGFLYLWRPGSGAKVGNITADNTFWSTGAASAAETGQGGGSATGSALTALDGDVLILEVLGTVAQGMATSYTWTFDYEGTTDPLPGVAISSAASFFTSTNDIPLFVPSTFIAAKNKPILQAVNRAANWCKHQRRDSGLYTPRRRVLLPTS